MSMDTRVLDEAMKFVRRQVDKNQGDVPDWGPYQKLVEEHLKDGFNLPFKMPAEYYYAYLRGKGFSDAECLARMGQGTGTDSTVPVAAQRPFWKFW